LLRAYHRRGDTTARERLIEVYLPLVESFARRYSRSSDDYDDLYQVGCIGLIQAIDRFQVDRGGELAAFAVPNIAGEIRRYLRDRGGSVRLPRTVLELRGPALETQRELATSLERAPTNAEIAARLGADEADVAVALDARRFSQAYELGPDSASAPQPLDAVEDRVFLSEAFRGLDEAERRILYMRFVRDLKAADVARELGISVRQLTRRTEAALGKLRHELERSSDDEEQPAAVRRQLPARCETVSRTMADPESFDERYLAQPYHVAVVREPRAEDGWTARVEELPGCVATGRTRVDAVARVDQAMREWIADALAHGRDVPRPHAASSHSGRLLVRMPRSLHADLSSAAEREEVSLNQFITSVLASAVAWRKRDRGEPTAPSADERARRRALNLNVAVLWVVALTALVLLVVELVQRL
jgi:RNA polymerase sigma-B factor